MEPAESWSIEGDYFEGCNCDVVCPCVVLGAPTMGDCQVTAAWHIESGRFRATPLDGLNVVMVVYAPGHMLNGPKWHAALYLDEQASQEQADALGKVFSGQAGGFFGTAASLIGEVLGVRTAPIEFNVDGKRRMLRIPAVLDLGVEAIAGANTDNDVLLTNAPLGLVPDAEMVVARSTTYAYRDHGMEWSNAGKNSFYTRFKYAA